MDYITYLEGLRYFFDHAVEVGMIISKDNSPVDLCSIHTDKNWKDCKKDILEKIRYREMVDDFILKKTTIMKNGLFNHVFKVTRSY